MVERVSVIFNLWAPFAAKLGDPCALSRSLVSISGVITSSVIVNPTLWLPVLEYLLTTIVWSKTSTKLPLV